MGVGAAVGADVGAEVGDDVGFAVGMGVGLAVGEDVGVGVGSGADKDGDGRSSIATRPAKTALTTMMTANAMTTILVRADFEETTRILFFNSPISFLAE